MIKNCDTPTIRFNEVLWTLLAHQESIYFETLSVALWLNQKINFEKNSIESIASRVCPYWNNSISERNLSAQHYYLTFYLVPTLKSQ